MKTKLAAIVLAVSVLTAGYAVAHGVRSQFGGVVASAANMQFELVGTSSNAVIHVSGHHGEKISTMGATGTLTVVNGSAKTELPLTSNGANMMQTKADAKFVAGAMATAAITFADKNVVSVKFIAK